MRTHSLFISVKLRSRNSSASFMLPPSPSYSEPVSGRSPRDTCANASSNAEALPQESRHGGLLFSKLDMHSVTANISRLWRGLDLAQVGSQKQAASGVLNTFAHFHKILQDVFCMCLLGSDEARAHSAEEVPVNEQHRAITGPA